MQNTNPSPWLSVIIPIYNAEKYLSKCIKSILKQTFKDFELILVDDGSTDSSLEICRKLQEKDNRVRVFHKENGGSLQTRVFGAEKSTGEYVLFCDADDYYPHDECFQILKNKTENSKFDFIQFGISKKFEPHFKRRISSSEQVTSGEEFYNLDYPILLCSFYSKSRLTCNVWNKLYNKNLMTKLPSSNTIKKIFMGDDVIINMYLLENINSALYISDELYVYRNMVGGTSSYRPNEMKNMDILKSYQSDFLQRWSGRDKEAVIRMHYAETAGWFYTYIQQSLSVLTEKEVRAMIEDSLNIPGIVKAREYLMSNTENYPEFKLLVAADPDLYISEAKKIIKNMSLKDKIKRIIKRILPKIFG